MAPEKKVSQVTGRSLKEIEEEYVSVEQMQRSIMPEPERFELFGNYDIYGETVPTARIGGDFYDFVDLEGRFGLEGRVGIVIADAAGHGLAAAMLIRDFNTALYTAISCQAHFEKDTSAFLFSKINRRMYRSSQPNQFITCFYGELHRNGKIRYINCGHYSPMLYRPNQVERLSVGGPVLGAFHEPPLPFEVGEVEFRERDVLVCFTDGVVEASNASGEEYGEQRLMDMVQRNQDDDPKELYRRIMDDVEGFSGGIQLDDRTLLISRRNRKRQAHSVETDRVASQSSTTTPLI